MSSGDDWCTIESDPGVFTELLEELGCTQVQLEELWALEDETLTTVNESGEIYGLIFLFQWQTEGAADSSAPTSSKPSLAEDQVPEGLFFAHQVTTNACATQAILSVVLNAKELELGPVLSEFRSFTASFPPSLKGVAISSSEPIKKAHNAFGRADAFLNDGKYISHTRGSEDVFHFVAYIPKDGTVYELDGLKQGPVIVGEHGEEEGAWLKVARTAIQERMSGDAIKFNLMAVTKDKRIGLQEKLSDSDGSEKESLAYQLELEEGKRRQWKLENQRRRHNYVPLCVSLIKEFARAGKLPKLVEDAKERKRQKIAAKK